MGLTDTGFLVLLVVLAAGAVVATVVFWPRLAGPGVLPIVGRVATLVVTNALVLLVAATAMNDTYVFFGDWADLFGTATYTHTTAAAGGSVAGAMAAPVLGRTPDGGGTGTFESSVPTATTGPGSAPRLERFRVSGTASGISGQVVVLLPRGYSDPANATRRYPVIEGFPGYSGTPIGLVREFDMATALDTAAQSRRMGPAIVVVAGPWIPSTRDTECVDGPGGVGGGDQVETWSTVDVPAWLASRFRVQQQRSSWATMGISAGGWCAAMAAMLHPDRFAAGVVLAGYFRPDWGGWVPFAPGDTRLQRYDLVRLAGQSPPPVALYVGTSTGDSLSYPSTKELLHAARAPLSITAKVSSFAGHRVSLWVPWFQDSLSWLGANVPGFAPSR